MVVTEVILNFLKFSWSLFLYFEKEKKLIFFPCSPVPGVYPVDLFEHMWAVDRLQRLGVSRYFDPEIKECINYVSRYEYTLQ